MKIAQTTDNVVTWIFFADSLPDHLPNVYEVGLSSELIAELPKLTL